MGDSCMECAKRAEEIYWAHFPNIHFSQFLLNGFDQQLAIPTKFSDNLRKKLPDFVTLKGPGGGMWRVGVTKMDDSVFFKHGWQEFVNDHGLVKNDLLVFKYCRESHFDVLIFDGQSLCEKEYSYFVKKCGRIEHDHGGSLTKSRETCNDKINNASSENVGCFLLEKSKNDGGITVSSGEQVIAPEQVITRIPDDNLRRINSALRKVRTKSSAKRTMPSPCPEGVFSESGVNRLIVVEDELGSQATSGLRTMHAIDEEQAARSFSSKLPNFVMIMKKFNVSSCYTLRIPFEFCSAHLPNCKTEIVLRNGEGKCWNVNSVPASKGRPVHNFCGGWKAFVRGNDVHTGDICIFELVGRWEMRVHISRVGKRAIEHRGGEEMSR